MGVSGIASCVKVFMFIANFIFWLLGCGILGLAIWAFVDPKIQSYWDWADKDAEVKAVIDEYVGQLKYAAIILMVLGGVILIIGFLGCCGAIKESQILLATYSIILFVILSGLVAAGVYFVIQRKDLFTKFESALETKVLNRDLKKRIPDPTANTILLVPLEQQAWLKCCGVKSWKDYITDASAETFSTIKAKYSCTNAPDTNAKGCASALVTSVQDNIFFVGYGAAGAGGLCLIGIIAALCLCCSIKD